MDDLHIVYNFYISKPTQPEPNKRYPFPEYKQFPSLIPETEWIEQPGIQFLDSIQGHVWCTKEALEFTIRGSEENKYELTESDFENAKRLEKLFEKYAERVVYEP